MEGLTGDLVTANLILVGEKILDAYGHVSVRAGQDADSYLLARYLPPRLVTAGDVRPFGLDGQLVQAEDCELYSERFIHAAVYSARPDVGAVCHTHAPELLPFGVTGTELVPVCHTASMFGTGLPLFDAYDPDTGLLISDLAQARRLARTLGRCKGALMRGHGAVVVGDNLADVTMSVIYLVQNAKVLLAAALLGGKYKPLTEAEFTAAAARIGRPASLHRAWSHLADLWK